MVESTKTTKSAHSALSSLESDPEIAAALASARTKTRDK